ncbi:unnamed protein product, partial [Mesorhabditis spiculigera]
MQSRLSYPATKVWSFLAALLDRSTVSRASTSLKMDVPQKTPYRDRVGGKMLFWTAGGFAFMLFVIVLLFNSLARDSCPHFAPRPVPEEEHLIPFAGVQDEIDEDNIKKYLRLFTKTPHMAGTKNQKELADTVEDLWKKFGVEDVRQVEYEVLLTYPKWEKPNKLYIKSGRKTVYQTSGIAPALIEKEQDDKFGGYQFLAWSAVGNASGQVVFCNRGFIADFEKLEELGYSVKGKIALIRYGQLYRGDKVYNAQKYGAIGVLLYSDPADVAKEGTKPENLYPHKIWMPENDVQRGMIGHHMNGDPLTPLYPAKPGIYKSKTIEQLKKSANVPSIPALPIPYAAAYEILARMSGPKVPRGWRGGLDVSYRVGSKMKDDTVVTFEVDAIFETRTIQNVIGYIKGREDPDRYVILGNHFDAWAYGSMDPNSGTAILAELIRALTKTVKETGWRPARTIMFANWDAEEYGLIGSTEFVEEYGQQLQDRTVVYLNMDCLVGNLTLDVASVPSLYNAIVETAKAVENPNEQERKLGRRTVFDSWNFYAKSRVDPNIPKIAIPGGGTDHQPFLHFLGIPTVDFTFENPYTGYPLYHTMYETAYVNENLLDNDDFAVHKATAEIWAQLALRFADSRILPINATQIPWILLQSQIPDIEKEVRKVGNEKALPDTYEQIEFLKKACRSLIYASDKFYAQVADTKKGLTRWNDHLMTVERCFYNPIANPEAPDNRHILYSINPENRYYARTFGQVRDSLTRHLKTNGTTVEDLDREMAQGFTTVQRANYFTFDDDTKNYGKNLDKLLTRFNCIFVKHATIDYGASLQNVVNLIQYAISKKLHVENLTLNAIHYREEFNFLHAALKPRKIVFQFSDSSFRLRIPESCNTVLLGKSERLKSEIDISQAKRLKWICTDSKAMDAINTSILKWNSELKRLQAVLSRTGSEYKLSTPSFDLKCHKRFRAKTPASTLIEHILSRHYSKLPLLCRVCGQVFPIYDKSHFGQRAVCKSQPYSTFDADDYHKLVAVAKMCCPSATISNRIMDGLWLKYIEPGIEGKVIPRLASNWVYWTQECERTPGLQHKSIVFPEEPTPIVMTPPAEELLKFFEEARDPENRPIEIINVFYTDSTDSDS